MRTALIRGDKGGEELGRHEGLLEKYKAERTHRLVLENGVGVWDEVFEAEFEGFGGAAAGFGREEEDAEDIDVAAHFFLTASSVAELAADAESSEICCKGGLEADGEG